MLAKRQIALLFCLLLAGSWVIMLPNFSVAASGVYKADVLWEKTYGGAGDDRAFYAAALPEGFLVVGSTTSLQPNKTMALALKLDDEGNMLWNRTFSDTQNSEFRYVLILDDGFLFVGNTFLTSGATDGYVVKTDHDGKPLWQFSISNGGVDKLFSAVQTQDGFVLAGLTNPVGGSGSDVWVVKISEDGHLVWSKTYDWGMDDAGRAVLSSAGNQYFIVGYTNSAGNDDYDFLLLKIDAEGNLLWNRTYGGAQSDKAYAMLDVDGGLLLVGDTRSKGAGDSDAWVIKVDFEGNLIWERTVGGSGFDMPTCISNSASGGYVVGGFTFSFGEGYRDFWLFKIDDAGNVLWQATVGKGNYEEAYGVVEVAEDTYVMAGWTNSIGRGAYDFYIVKINVGSGDVAWIVYVAVCLATVLLLIAILLLLTRHKSKNVL
ncbi:MAG: PQQ-binding-like beta-propeller repeat protein [Candidatus Bathyarchaeales archaeon]